MLPSFLYILRRFLGPSSTPPPAPSAPSAPAPAPPAPAPLHRRHRQQKHQHQHSEHLVQVLPVRRRRKVFSLVWAFLCARFRLHWGMLRAARSLEASWQARWNEQKKQHHAVDVGPLESSPNTAQLPDLVGSHLSTNFRSLE